MKHFFNAILSGIFTIWLCDVVAKLAIEEAQNNTYSSLDYYTGGSLGTTEIVIIVVFLIISLLSERLSNGVKNNANYIKSLLKK